MNIPTHLPRRLTITLWDFSWYTMAGPEEPFEDLDRCFQEAADRGYNTVRICAMPLMLFDDDGPRGIPIEIGTLGDVGRRTRWYNLRGGTSFDGLQRLELLFQAARRRGMFVILSSWEYQQATTFLKTKELRSILDAIAPEERFIALARAWDRLLGFLRSLGLVDRVAYVEIHNEAEYGQLAEVALNQGVAPSDARGILGHMKTPLSEAVDFLRGRHPDLLFTGCFGLIEAYPKSLLPANLMVGHFHLYVRGVLQELMDKLDLEGTGTFPNDFARSLLRPDAPEFPHYRLPPGEEWRLEGNPVGLRLLYIHDWCDPMLWDRFLYERYGDHRLAMRWRLEDRLNEAAVWAQDHGVPLVLGEGYLGYTPLEAGFEEGPIGKALCELALTQAKALGAWGAVLCSNAAPHHPFWADREWQRRWNRAFLSE